MTEPHVDTTHPSVEQRLRRVRRAAYIVAATVLVWLVCVVAWSLANDLNRGEVYDPFTGQRLSLGSGEP